jgi:hypothetical protein
MAEASVADVREVIDTDLDDLAIQAILDRAARSIDRRYDAEDFDSTVHRSDTEAVLTALRIAGGRDRREISASSESTSVTFEIAETRALRAQLARIEPGSEFSIGGVNRDTDRFVSSANNPRDDVDE